MKNRHKSVQEDALLKQAFNQVQEIFLYNNNTVCLGILYNIFCIILVDSW